MNEQLERLNYLIQLCVDNNQSFSIETNKDGVYFKMGPISVQCSKITEVVVFQAAVQYVAYLNNKKKGLINE